MGKFSGIGKFIKQHEGEIKGELKKISKEDRKI